MGGLMLYEGSEEGVHLSMSVLVTTVGIVSAFFAVVAGLAFRAQTAGARTGRRGLIGEIGTVKQAIDPEGKVFVHGELWKARSASVLDVGQDVRVLDIEGLTMIVEAARQDG
jgi:membrane-bound serine protease (ClpP class)